MSQFNYLNEVNNIFKMDGDLTVNCPAPRWQKKKLETSNTSMLSASMNMNNTSKLSMSYNNSYTTMAALSGKTPQKMGKSPGM